MDINRRVEVRKEIISACLIFVIARLNSKKPVATAYDQITYHAAVVFNGIEAYTGAVGGYRYSAGFYKIGANWNLNGFFFGKTAYFKIYFTAVNSPKIRCNFVNRHIFVQPMLLCEFGLVCHKNKLINRTVGVLRDRVKRTVFKR